VHASHGSSYLPSVTERGFGAYALFNLAMYLWNLALPTPIFPLDVRELVSNVWLISGAGLGLLLGLVILTRRLLRGVPGGSFFALWPLIAILPVLPVAPGQRFLYLPSVGFCVAVALAVEHAWARRPREVRRRFKMAL